jgi:hypothetical protein
LQSVSRLLGLCVLQHPQHTGKLTALSVILIAKSYKFMHSSNDSMVGSLNKLPIAVAGMVFFDAVITPASISGVVLAFLAGLVYSYAKAQQAGKSTLPQYKEVKGVSKDAD